MKKFKLFAVTIASALMVVCNSTVCFAAPQTMADGTIFDAEYYAAKNPDVVAVMGTDANTLYAHYSLFGRNEGRLPYDGAVALPVKRSNVSESLAQARYDVFYNNFGVDIYTNDPAVFFDADYYLANYPELAVTVGTDYRALFNHYINIGRFEGRTVRMGVYPERGNLDKYRLCHPDGTVTTELPNNTRLTTLNSEIQMIEWLGSVVNDSMSEREIVTVIHDEICNRTVYGPIGPSINADFEPFKTGTAHTICMGYSHTFAVLCKLAGIEVQRVYSNAMGHEWNRVKVDGIWYDVDVTWDDCGWGYTYFLIPAGTGVFAGRQIDGMNPIVPISPKIF